VLILPNFYSYVIHLTGLVSVSVSLCYGLNNKPGIFVMKLSVVVCSYIRRAWLVSSVDCDFESAFKCGYTSTELGSLSWTRTNSENLLKSLTGPTEDSHKSTTGKRYSKVKVQCAKPLGPV